MSKRNMRTGNPRETTRGAILVWTACSLTALVGFTALAVDVGYTYAVRGELQRTADAAAMAAASQLARVDGDPFAVATQYSLLNAAGGVDIQLSGSDVEFGRAVLNADGKYTFEVGGEPVDSVRVTVRRTADSPNGALSLFFGPALGVSETNLAASATAMAAGSKT